MNLFDCGGFMFHAAPTCPWCESVNTWAEFGMFDVWMPAQLSPYVCQDCGAIQFWTSSDRQIADEEENAAGWFKAPTLAPPIGVASSPDLWEPLGVDRFVALTSRFSGLPPLFVGELL